MKKTLILVGALSALCACTFPQSTKSHENVVQTLPKSAIKMGAEATDSYFHLIEGKSVAVLTNQTGMVGDEHLVDLLKRKEFNVVGILSPEHGFRGTADAGEHVASSVDEKTGIPIWSLYDGKSGKPSAETMQLFEVLVFDQIGRASCRERV